MHLKYLLISIALLFTINTIGQKNQQASNKELTDYYLESWNTNLDSTMSSWIVKRNLTDGERKARAELVGIPGYSEMECQKYITDIHSTIPMRYHPRVNQIVTTFLNQNGSLGIGLAYSEYLDSEFEKLLTEANLPLELKHLPLALSAMNNKAFNKVGAAGQWQLMYTNARRQGLRVDSYVDERLAIHKSAKAAISELKILFELYKNWELTLAAYACGPTNVNKAIRRNNNQFDFYEIYASLPEYNRDIVPAFTAACIVAHHQEAFNIKKPNWDFTVKVDTVEVSSRLHFIQLERILKISIEELQFLNPQYKYDIVPAIDEVFEVLLPAGNLEKFNELEDSIYHFQDTILFQLKKAVVLPPAAKGRHYARYEPELPPDNSTLLYYTIRSGDNLGYISSWYGVKVREIEDWNNIYDPRRLKLGKKLKIYVPKNKAAYYKPVNDLSFEQKQKRVGKTVSAGSKTAAPKKEEPLGKDFFWYTVRSGESPYTIAKKYNGVSADDILRWNSIKDPRNIKVGQKLKIKKIK